MPTILMVLGLRVVVYPNDHRPAHVHVMGRGCEAVFRLCCPDGPPELRENYGFARKDLGRVAAELRVNLSGLCHDWSRIHGSF